MKKETIENILLIKFFKQEETARADEYGFRQGRSTVDAIFVLWHIVEKSRNYGKCTAMALFFLFYFCFRYKERL